MDANINKGSWKLFFFRIILPSLLAVVLFVLTIFIMIIPRFQENIMAYKREMIKELTNSAYSVLAQYEKEERAGALSREEAQKTAISKIEYLRYGEENKDYFWITDMHPRMIMHPYLKYLDDHDLTDFKDPHGKRMFVEFVNAVKDNGHGYVDYMWQYKDDSTHIVPKISYVRSFEPWGWIIGTGVYVEDVKKEIRSLTGKLVKISLGITIFITLLLIINTYQSVVIERRRLLAEERLKESRERYKSLVEAATEGLVMLVDGSITHSNKTFSDLIGYDKEELLGKSFTEIITSKSINALTLNKNGLFEKDGQFEIVLLHKDGKEVTVLSIISSIDYSQGKANIIIVKDITSSEGISLSSVDYETLINNLNLGIFRTTVDLKGSFITANNAAVKMLGYDSFKELSKVYVLELFDDIDDKRNFRRRLLEDGFINNKLMNFTDKKGHKRMISLSLIIKTDENNTPVFCDAVVEDVTGHYQYRQQSEELITDLQNSWMFLEQNICDFLQPALIADLAAPISVIAASMTENQSDYIILSQNNDAVGLITDEDLRARGYAEQRDSLIKGFEIMSSPLIYIGSELNLKEALMVSERKKISHLIVKDADGIKGVVNRRKLWNEIEKSTNFLYAVISSFSNIKELKLVHDKLQLSVKPYIESGVNSSLISRKIAEFSDLIMQRVIELAVKQLGEPPVPFSFIILGSVGRCEQTLATDQDNAIIYQDTEKQDEEKVQQYFLRLGEIVCTDLNTIGYTFCKGNNMASNPKWCQPYTKWEKYFAYWIMTPDPKNLLDISIFFDFRSVYGDDNLAINLRKFIFSIIENKTSFFYNLIDNINNFKVSLSGSTSLVIDQKTGDELFDIKKPVAIMVMFARIYTIYHRIEETNTVKRIELLKEFKVLNEEMSGDFIYEYNYLMQIRFNHQLALINAESEANNMIRMKDLREAEMLALKKIISHISSYQSKLNLDFKGITL